MLQITDQGEFTPQIPKVVYDFIAPRKVFRVVSKTEKWGHTFVIEFPERAIVGVDGMVSFISENDRAEVKDWVLFGWIKKLIDLYADNTDLLSILIAGAVATWILQQGDLRVLKLANPRIEVFLKATITFNG